MKIAQFLLAAIAVLLLGIGLFVWSGMYNPGADRPHWKITYTLMETARDRAVEQRTSTIALPSNLDDPQKILKGAGQYAEMCISCHLAPGVSDTELRQGLYPKPPDFSKVRVDPREAFWVTKHGLKMSAMPAWGLSHNDDTIWSMVAFLQKLPGMTPAQYKDIVARATPHHAVNDATISTPDGHSQSGHAHGGH